mgnify:CR=1 FL=1
MKLYKCREPGQSSGCWTITKEGHATHIEGPAYARALRQECAWCVRGAGRRLWGWGDERRRQEGAGGTKRTLKKMLKVVSHCMWSEHRAGAYADQEIHKSPVTRFLFCLKKDRLKRSKSVWFSFLISLTRVRTGRKVISHLFIFSSVDCGR